MVMHWITDRTCLGTEELSKAANTQELVKPFSKFGGSGETQHYKVHMFISKFVQLLAALTNI